MGTLIKPSGIAHEENRDAIITIFVLARCMTTLMRLLDILIDQRCMAPTYVECSVAASAEKPTWAVSNHQALEASYLVCVLILHLGLVPFGFLPRSESLCDVT
jgi:hypothetical protein